jgi:hypothetical protein
VTTFQWTDVNDVVWDLDGGLVALRPGVMGLGLPGTDQYLRSSAALDGQRLVGSRTRARRVFWPVSIRGTDEAEWLATSRAFFAGLSTDKTGTFEVTANDGQVRTIALRLQSQDEQEFDDAPGLFPFEVVGIDLVADDPFWRGPEVSKTFQTAEDSVPFFETGPTHVFNLMSSSTTASATVTNSGEVDSWPLWTVTGPATEFSIGVDGSVISGVIIVPDGQYLLIDTDPTVQVARLHDGASSAVVPFSSFTSIVFARIPQGESVPLEIVLKGSGSVNISFEPGFRRAF